MEEWKYNPQQETNVNIRNTPEQTERFDLELAGFKLERPKINF